ncbi:MAG: undecaprenyl-diphosphate phosphatase, partial [Planctomycetota bacterium]
SSTGHLQALKKLLPIAGEKDLTLDVYLHLATLLVVLVMFRRELRDLIAGIWKPSAERTLFLKVMLAAIPAGLLGLTLQGFFETLPENFPYALPLAWLAMACVLFSLRLTPFRHDGTRSIGWRTAIWIGAWQMLALFPGISRSGITIAAALWCGCQRENSLRFSFLVACPLIAGAGMLRSVKLAQTGLPSWDLALVYLAGGVAAFGSGMLFLRLLRTMVGRGSLYLWGYYLLAVAAGYGGWLLSTGAD